MKISIISILLFFVFTQLNAQDKKWTLEDCIQYAYENNIQLKQSKLNTEFNKVAYKQSKFDLTPSVGISNPNLGFSFGRGKDPVTNSYKDQNNMNFSFGFGASVNLFNGFKDVNNIKKAEIDLLASIENVKTAKNSLAINIASAFLNVLYYKELKQTAIAQSEVTKQQLVKIKALIEAGSKPKGDLLEQKSQLAREELQIIQHQNSLDLALLNLAQMLDLKKLEGFDIAIPNLPVIKSNEAVLNYQEVYNKALTFRPEIKSKQYGLESAKKDLKIAYGNFLPKLSMSAGWSTNYYDVLKPKGIEVESFSDQIKNNAGKSLGFSLTIPLYERMSKFSGVKRAKISILNKELELENTKNALLKEIQQARTGALAAMKKYYSSLASVEANEESFRYNQEKFNVGMLNEIDYNQAKTKLLNAKSDLLQAKYEYIFKTKILEFYNGQEIKL